MTLSIVKAIFAYCHIQALYAECDYAECRYAECRGTKISNMVPLNEE